MTEGKEDSAIRDRPGGVHQEELHHGIKKKFGSMAWGVRGIPEEHHSLSKAMSCSLCVKFVTPDKCCSQKCAALRVQLVEVGWLST